MKKNLITIGILILLTALTTIYSYYLTNLSTLDEIWNYGFAKNILDGLVPYKDFNMIVLPFFPYLLAFVLAIFGEKLLVYYLLIAIMVSIITYLSYKKIGWYAIIIYLLLLVYSTNGYNTITLVFFMILLLMIEKESKYQDILIPIIISFMILSKQTMALLIIPSVYYSKKKKKTILSYIIMFLIFLIYLLWNNNLLECIDYCFLGMFEFTEKNHISIFAYLLVEIIACIGMLYLLIRSKGSRKDVFYCLMYQIITFPIVDVNHFILAVIPIIYLVFQEEKLSSFYKAGACITLLTVAISLLVISNYTMTFKIKNYLVHSKEKNYLENKLITSVTNEYIKEMGKFRKKYPNHQFYILGNYSYLVKLSLNIPINKYDLINNGNMGYHGSKKYMEEIQENCSKQECLFIVNEKELQPKKYVQTNTEILEYVTQKYKKIYSSSAFGVYTN